MPTPPFHHGDSSDGSSSEISVDETTSAFESSMCLPPTNGDDPLLPIVSGGASKPTTCSKRDTTSLSTHAPTADDEEEEPSDEGVDPLPQQASPYATEGEVQSLHTAFNFAAFIGKPLNFAATVNLMPHDVWKEGERLLRRSVFASVNEAYRASGCGSSHYVFVFENPDTGGGSGGGRGLHLHILAHVPTDRYQHLIHHFKSVFAKHYGKRINKMLDTHASDLKAAGIKLHYRSTMLERYRALAKLKAFKHASMSAKTHGELAKRKKALSKISLPFWISDDCMDAPLSSSGAMVKLRYMAKSIDPETKTQRLGVPTTIGEISRVAMAEKGYASIYGVKLEKQCCRRFKRGNMGSSKNLSQAAQKACKDFSAPDVPLGDWLEPHAALETLVATVKTTLTALHRQHQAERYAAAYSAVRETAEQRHENMRLLAVLLGDEFEPFNDHHDDDDQADIAALGTERRKLEALSTGMPMNEAL